MYINNISTRSVNSRKRINTNHTKLTVDTKIATKKRKTNNKNDEEEEDDDDDNEFEGELPQIACVENDTIYRIDNHIYFRSRVSTLTISKLCKIIADANNEFINLQKNIRSGKLVPTPLYLHITSDGGTLMAGFMGYDAIQNSRIPIYTIIEGYAFSAGTVLSIAGKKRYMTKSSYMLIHQLSAGCQGNFEQIKDSYINNEQLMKHLKEIYAEKTNNKLKGKKLDDILKRDIYINCELCMNLGLIDDVYQEEQYKCANEL